MNRLRRWRPSPALAIACLALFVSLGGVSYGVATGSIDSREIRNNTVRSVDIRNNEVRGRDVRNSSLGGADMARDKLTGADVLESSLGTVPRSANATNAGSADAVGGVTFRRFSYVAQEATGFSPVLDFGGLLLEAECQADGDLRVRGNPAAGLAGSEIRARGFAASDSSFTPGDNATVVAEADADPEPADRAAVGTIVFVAPDGRVVTIDAQAIEDRNDVIGTTNDCGFMGVAARG